jgi:hypothetical protein
MYNFGKAGFDPGHYKGQNIGPNGYREGDVMLRLGLKLQQKYGIFLTRKDNNDVSFQARAQLAKAVGCNTLISIHTNAPGKKQSINDVKGIIVFYSMQHPEDRAMAEYIGNELAKVMGTIFRGAKTRPSEKFPTQDYYAMIRRPEALGIEHPFIVEHGSHWEMAINTEDKLNKIVECYGRILGLVHEMTFEEAEHIIAEEAGIDPAYWVSRKNIDPYFAAHEIKVAAAFKKKGG